MVGQVDFRLCAQKRMKQVGVKTCVPEQLCGVTWPCWCPVPGPALLRHVRAEGNVNQCKHCWVSVWTSQFPGLLTRNLTCVWVFQSGCCERWVRGMTLSSACCEMGSLVWLDTDLMTRRHEMILCPAWTWVVCHLRGERFCSLCADP